MLRLLATGNPVSVHWLVFSSNSDRAREAARSASAFLKGARKASVAVKSFRDGFFPYVGGEIKECFEELKPTVEPDLIFTHWGGDLHQDHRVISELTWNTFRDHLILEYEIPKYDADLAAPNSYMPLTQEICRKKVRCLMRFFGTQRNRHWFSEDLFLGLMRLRGVECNSPTRFAEAFHCRKMTLGLG
jgi:LmbE family N-acetylglucosaminyl deacetylase